MKKVQSMSERELQTHKEIAELENTFLIDLKKAASNLTSTQDFMLYLIQNSGDMKEIPKEFVGKGFDKLLETCKFANMTEEEQMTYVRRMKVEWDRENQLNYAESRGEARGEARGIEKTARAMKARGMEVSVIADITGLTPEQIVNL